MSDLATPPPAAAAPPLTPAAKPAAEGSDAPAKDVKPPEAEPEEEFDIDGERRRLSKTQQRTFIQKGAAADKRFQEAAEARRALEEWEKLFDADPEAALRKRGKDPEKALAALMEKRAKDALLTPEQREKARVEKERDDAKAELAKRDAEAKQRADAEEDARVATELEGQLIAAADEYGLDGTPETLEGLCDVALDLLNMGIPKPTPAQIVQEFIRRDQEHLERRDRKLLGRLKGDALKTYLKGSLVPLGKLAPAELLEVLGPALVKAVQDATLTKIPGPGAAPAQKSIPVPPRHPTNGRYVSESEVNKKLGIR